MTDKNKEREEQLKREYVDLLNEKNRLQKEENARKYGNKK